MAASANESEDMISGINVTPLVDVVLVLLVVLMITANYVVSKSIPMDLPKGATGEATVTTLSLSIDAAGAMYLDAEPVSEAVLSEKVRAAYGADKETRAVIAADGKVPHSKVVHAIDLLRRENVTKFAINVQPEELAPSEPGNE